MITCNHGPSRIYRQSYGIPANWPAYHAIIVALCDIYGKLCSTPETTTVCATNGDTFATYHWDWCSCGDYYATANYDPSNVCN